ncbi:2Fe-2S iron-sulfur cluster-binding protein [Rhodoplanes roseus]|uniref:Ferredoxin n=1 Tax=Rhodoplanes roseus TaxID=29409 RepID=A0A327KKR5_9BRAD|nr:2Fe-2S iron-sulfur cluster-binding protein [Rhodoplanes roseus]RAI38821.1 ferredoxin [Rhodoplanes roseus]
MTDVTFILRDGSRRTLDIPEGSSVMQAAVMENLKGIDGECGGCLSCATCHVYIEAIGAGELPPIDEEENALLDGVAAERRPESRLSCQILATPGLSGLVLRVPERQM